MIFMKVLVAEDNAINQLLARGLLKRCNAIVTVVVNGREAVDAWSAGPFDLILMDIQMPEMDGLEATRVIRSRELPGAHTPIIAVTARAMTGDREACLAAGMDGYISKPIRSVDLMAMIARLTVVAASTVPTRALP